MRDLHTARRGTAPARPRLVALSATAGLVVVLVAVALLAQALARPTSVYAGWTAVPASPDPAFAAAANADCRAGMVSPPPDAEPESVGPPAERHVLAGLGDAAALPLVALDQRGQVAMALFSDGNSFATCMVLRSPRGGATAVVVGTIEQPRAADVRVLSAMAHEGEPPLRMVVGDVSGAVASVLIDRGDGVEVAASVAAGYFLAWWPSDAGVTSIRAYDAAGELVQTLSGDLFD